MHRTRSRAAKIGVIAFEIVGVVIAVAAAGAGLLYWRLQSGPVSLAVFENSAEYALARALPRGYSTDIRSPAIASAGDAGAYELTLRKLIVSNPDDVPIAELSAIGIEFNIPDLFRGAIGPRRVVVEDAVLAIERGAVRKKRPARKEGEAPIRNLLRGKFFHGAFSNAEIRNARVSYRDAASNRAWIANRASARLERSGGGLVGRAQGIFDIDGEPASLAVNVDYVDEAETFNATVDVAGAPLGDILELLQGRDVALLAAPVTGRASLTLTQAVKIVSSQIDARVGAGEFLIGEERIPLDYADIHAAFDPTQNGFQISQIEFSANGSRGAIAGDVGIEFSAKTGKPRALRFDIGSEELVLDTKGFLPEHLTVEALRLAGSYDIDARRVTADTLSAYLLGVTISGDAEFSPGLKPENGPRASPGVRASLAVDGVLEREQILLGWPTTLGLGAREFILTRLPEGYAKNVALELDLPPGAMTPGEPMPDEALELTFDIADATAIYGEGMTPLTRAQGKARLTGNRFFISPIEGRVGAVKVSKGEIDFTALSPRGQPVYYRFTADGKAKDILGVLNEEPMAVLKGTNFEPSRFVGDVSLRAEIMRPNLKDVPRTEYEYRGKASFDDLTVSELFGNIDLESAAGVLDLKARSLTVTADGGLGGAPVSIEWDQAFSRDKGSSKLKVSGEIDAVSGDVLGLSQRGLVRGVVSYSAEAVGSLNGIDRLRATADFKRAGLSIAALSFEKPPDSPARGAIDLVFDGETVEVRDFALTSDVSPSPAESTELQSGENPPKEVTPIAVFGTARFGPLGFIENINLPRVRLGENSDFSIEAHRAESGILDLTLTGESIDVSGLIASSVEAGPRTDERSEFGWGAGAVIRGRVNKMYARGDNVYTDSTIDFRRGAERLEAFDFSARTDAGKPVSIVLKETGSETGPRQVVEARTDDIGSLLSSVFNIKSIKGGEGYMEVLVGGGESGAQGISGKLEARGARVVKAPLLARIFSAGSFNGLSDLVNGEGIAFSEAVAKFQFADGIVSIEDARATGPSVGITGQGQIAAGDGGGISLAGAVAPAYQVNALLGKAPLIGDILVNREGEGLVALSYTVTGAAESPTVTVNPLSALAPGFLRRMFETQEELAPSAQELPVEPAAQPPEPQVE